MFCRNKYERCCIRYKFYFKGCIANLGVELRWIEINELLFQSFILIGRNANLRAKLRNIGTKQQQIKGNFNVKHSYSYISTF